MKDNFYDKQQYNFKCVKGDTKNIPLSFYDESNVAVDITAYDATFTLIDPVTGDPIAALQKTHDDAITGGDGIYFYGDTQTWAELGLTASNQCQIVLTDDDTDTLVAGRIYRWDLELQTTINGETVRQTAVVGWLEILREATANV